MLRHLLSGAWRQRCDQPGRSAEFQRRENCAKVCLDSGRRIGSVSCNLHGRLQSGWFSNLTLPSAPVALDQLDCPALEFGRSGTSGTGRRSGGASQKMRLSLRVSLEAERATILARVRRAEQGPALPIDPNRLRAANRRVRRPNYEAARLERGAVAIAQALLHFDDVRSRQRKQP